MSFRKVGSEIQAILGEWLENSETRRLVLQRTWQRAVQDRESLDLDRLLDQLDQLDL